MWSVLSAIETGKRPIASYAVEQFGIAKIARIGSRLRTNRRRKYHGDSYKAAKNLRGDGGRLDFSESRYLVSLNLMLWTFGTSFRASSAVVTSLVRGSKAHFSGQV